MRVRIGLAILALGAYLVAVVPHAAHGATPAGYPPTPPVPPAAYHSVVSDYRMIRMDDGVRLGATITLPSRNGKTPAPGRFPVVFSMTPYGRDGVCGCPDQSFYAEHGIVSAVVDVRGTGGSEGTLDGNYFAPREARDGYDLVEWFARQRWSDGRVAMDGGSYLGILQYLTAELDPPHLVAIVPEEALSDLYRDAYAPGGIPNLFFDGQYTAVQGGPGAASGDIGEPGDSGAGYDTSLRDLFGGIADTGLAKADQARSRPTAFDFLERPNDDAWYHARSPWYRVSRIKVPVLIVDGWRDGAFIRGDLEMFEALARRHRVQTRIDVYGCTHKGCGPPFDPTQSSADTDNIQAEEYDFLSHYLRGTREGLGPPVRYDVQPGSSYLTASEWPPPGVRWQRWYLHPDSAGTTGQPLTGALSVGGLSAQSGTRRTTARYFTDPAAGWSMTFNSYGTIAITPYVPTDQRLEAEQGLTWRSRPAPAAGWRLVGPIELHLVASSTAPNTDWVVRLSDVAPNGSETVITEGGLRAADRALDRRRSSTGSPYHLDERPVPLVPGHVYTFDVAIIATAYRLAPGHRLQLRLTTDDLPTRAPATIRYDAADPAASRVTPLLPAINTVYEGGRAGSWLLVPLMAGR